MAYSPEFDAAFVDVVVGLKPGTAKSYLAVYDRLAAETGHPLRPLILGRRQVLTDYLKVASWLS